MGWLESKYIARLSGRLRNFKQKSPNLFNFSCSFCGDSQQKASKARAYIYDKAGKVQFYCHNNCGGMSFSNFLKRIDTQLYNEYMLEKLDRPVRVETPDADFKVKEKLIRANDIKELDSLKRLSQLPWNHPAKVYVEKRQLPTWTHHYMRWAPKFQTWVNDRMLPGKYSQESLAFDEGRIVIPFWRRGKPHLVGYLGRAISMTEQRYMLNVLDHDAPLIWGIERVDFKYHMIVTEGSFDAMFLLNGIAMGGQNFTPLLDVSDRSKYTLVFDNEPRSKTTRDKMLHGVDNGFKICVWPSRITFKDINEMIVEGKYDPAHIKYIIDNNTFHGTEATLKVQEWTKT